MNRERIKPPRATAFLLNKILPGKDESFIRDEFEEDFLEISEREGLHSAKKWYWKQLLKTAPEFFSHKLRKDLSMFRNYFKVSLRNIKRHKSYSLLNILGLSVGLACVILIFIYIRYEM
ncbi:MAG: ABC transporter permease, partial [bacterium]|nr:ABC transporter permease [bacterium]